MLGGKEPTKKHTKKTIYVFKTCCIYAIGIISANKYIVKLIEKNYKNYSKNIVKTTAPY